MKYVIDASIAAKWFIEEEYSEESKLLLEKAYSLYVPELFFAEFGNILWKRVIAKEILNEYAVEILEAVDTFPLHSFENKSLLPSSFNIATEFKQTVYDSLYLALAVFVEAKFVTADQKFLSGLQESHLKSHLLHIKDLNTH